MSRPHHTNRDMKHSFLALIFGLLSFSVFADTTNLSLHIGTVSAQRQAMISEPAGHTNLNSVVFSIEATLDNQTGAPMTAVGHHSVFDSMCLVILDSNGRELAIRRYDGAFPTLNTKSFTLATGKTTNLLFFQNCLLPFPVQRVRVRVQGGLESSSISYTGSSYTGSITSNVVTVKIRM